MNNSDIGKFICELRKEKGLTQKELAERLNVTDKAVSKWETGRSAPDISLLTALSETLGVTVVEILNGKKIEKEKLSAVSDEVIVKTIKKEKHKHKRLLTISAIVMVFIALASVLSYPVYQVFNSVTIDNEAAIVKQQGPFDETKEDMKIVRAVKKGDFYFYLLQNENRVDLKIFEKNKLFDNRMDYFGGTGCTESNELGQYCCGTGNSTMNVFFGYGMTDTEYSYTYRGVKCTKQIEDETVLDVLIDINDSFTNASIIYDE